MTTPNNNQPVAKHLSWVKRLLISAPVGVLVGAPYPLLIYLSDAKDWGKGDYADYWDFAWRYWVAIGMFSILGVLVVLMLVILGEWILKRFSAHPKTVPPDRE